MKEINIDDRTIRFEYDNNDERQDHVTKLLHEGWTLTHLGGGKERFEVLFAEFKKEDK